MVVVDFDSDICISAWFVYTPSLALFLDNL